MSTDEPYDKPTNVPPINFEKINHREYIIIYKQYHIQSNITKLKTKNTINYSKKKDFIKHYTNHPYTKFSQKTFYKNNHFQKTTFIIESFLHTTYFEHNKSHYKNYHNPHPTNTPTNTHSLKFLDDPDHMYTQYHENYTTNPTTHTHHMIKNEKKQYTSYHIPHIINNLLFKSNTHQIDSIPNNKTTIRFNSTKNPNTCLLYHTNHNTK